MATDITNTLVAQLNEATRRATEFEGYYLSHLDRIDAMKAALGALVNEHAALTAATEYHCGRGDCPGWQWTTDGWAKLVDSPAIKQARAALGK
jgi:hypothetical protein